jgi:2-polyprenyl-3-methyl-5-hydroxy-6-metoxy-1,4-benzoquinol methylase
MTGHKTGLPYHFFFLFPLVLRGGPWSFSSPLNLIECIECAQSEYRIMHHLWIGVVSFLLRYWSSDVHHPSSSALVHKATRKTSGGDQYIHKENSDRQQLMNRLYWPSTLDAFDKFGILQEASRSDSFQVLEIGCGTGSTTYDLAKTLPKAWVIGIDTSEEMIALDKTSLTTYSDDIQRRVTFMVKNGEDVGTDFKEQFDIVWLRFVVVHVPDPMTILEAAMKSLKPGGKIVVEDVDASGQFSDPPLFACELLKSVRIEASLLVGGDVERGRMIGRYFHDLGMKNIRCDSFVPVYGRGLEIDPWERRGTNHNISQEEKYQLGLRFVDMTLDSLSPNLLERGLCTPEDLVQAKESISEATSQERAYQTFTFPGGKMFQWIATKK